MKHQTFCFTKLSVVQLICWSLPCCL